MNKGSYYQIGFAASLASLLILSACGNEEDQPVGSEAEGETSEEEDLDAEAETGGEVRVAYSAQPPILDPHEQLAIAVSDIMRHVYEPLVTVDAEYNVEPMLAETFEQSDDGTEVEFQLREGVLFHNGEEMTAEDVEASMNKWLDTEGSRDQFHEDAYVEAVDDYNVILHLQEPLATALPLLAFNSTGFPAIMPADTIEDADASGVSEYIGTGPFEFVEWQTDQHVHLQKFDDYGLLDEPADGLAGAREALVDDIYFEFVTDNSTRVSGMQSGEYDIGHAIPFDMAEQMEADPNIDTHTYPGGFLNIHFNKREGFFVDQEPRQALAASIDNEAIMIGGYSTEDFYVLNHNIMMYHQLEQWDSDAGTDVFNQNDPSNMEQYLDEIDYDGEVITIITTRDYEDQYNGAVVLQEQMERMGMNVDLEVYDWSTLLDLNRDESAYDIYVMGNVPVPDPTSNYFFDPEYPGWTDIPDEIFDLRESPSLEEGIAEYDNLLEWYWEDVPVLKVGDFTRLATSQNYIENFQYQDGFVFWNMSKNE